MTDDAELVYRQRLNALSVAVESYGGSSQETAVIVQRADVFFDFLLGVAPEKTTASDPAEKPKRTRKAATETPALTPTASDTAAPAPQEQKASASPAAASDDDFLNESPPAPKEEKPLTLADVRAALVDLQTKVSREVAMATLKEAGKAESLGGLKPEHFKAVIDEVGKQLKKAGK